MTARQPRRPRTVRGATRRRVPPPTLSAPPARPPRCGDPCPRCGKGTLDYNGLLELACTQCGYVAGGSGGGCT